MKISKYRVNLVFKKQPLKTIDPEISFIHFGACTSHDVIATHDKDCENLSLLAIDPVTETLPQQLMELDEERYLYYTAYYNSQ